MVRSHEAIELPVFTTTRLEPHTKGTDMRPNPLRIIVCAIVVGAISACGQSSDGNTAGTTGTTGTTDTETGSETETNGDRETSTGTSTIPGGTGGEQGTGGPPTGGVENTGGTSGTGGGGTTGGNGGTPVQGDIGLYRTFEKSINNDTAYGNRFADVDLEVTYTAPSGRTIDFYGFFDGDGNGGGDAGSGNVWKIRFMPDEVGQWSYTYSWSDGTPGGQDTFSVGTVGAGKGILRAYGENPRWFAYNGTEPVWIKSYYETGHGAIAQPFDSIIEHVYQPMIDRGYNHLQVNWLLPLCCDHQYYVDLPPKSIDKIRLYEEGKASSTQNLQVWQMMEQHVSWLNDRNVGLHMFLGFDGGRNDGPEWTALSEPEKRFYVRYVVSRLAPYANIAGWNFVWEVPGDRESHELGLMRLLMEYDVFEHLRTYEDEQPGSHNYALPEYTFAAVENHGYGRENRAQAWTHHEASLDGYVEGKPVYMSEGNALWVRFWRERTGATPDDLRQSAWACATAGASFNWCGHQAEGGLEAFGNAGLPFHDDSHPYAASARELDILAEVMTEQVEFFRMTPQDSLLSSHDEQQVWCLAETGRQYLVFSAGGSPFSLSTAPSLSTALGDYTNNAWIDAKSGTSQALPAVSGGSSQAFSPPSSSTDWVLVLREGS